jgi:hypothetical protein
MECENILDASAKGVNNNLLPLSCADPETQDSFAPKMTALAEQRFLSLT